MTTLYFEHLANLKLLILVKETPLSDIGDPTLWQYDYYTAYKQLGAGLCVGLSCLASGLTIGIAGEAGVKGLLHRDILIAVILLMIFAEALALYGFIVSIVLASA